MSTKPGFRWVRRRVREEYWHEGTKRMQAKVFVFYDVYIDGVLTETVSGSKWQAWKRKHREKVALFLARQKKIRSFYE